MHLHTNSPCTHRAEQFSLNGDDVTLSVGVTSRFFAAGLDAAEWIETVASSWHGNRSQVLLHVFVARERICHNAVNDQILKRVFFFFFLAGNGGVV